MADKAFQDILWVAFSAGLVFLMQAGFLCLETGLTRSKNNINVAIKNLADFGLNTLLFWVCGYALMFGASQSGWIGVTNFLPNFAPDHVWLMVFFFFQLMFCGTAVTILSGAIAERVRFNGYLIITALISALIYPLFGHWAWNGIDGETVHGWLAVSGFVDFAGSTVVHSVGGWAALAILLIVGPRMGRFSKEGPPKSISGANLPLATLGVFLLWFGWFGFNGGSTLALNAQVATILVNTVLAGATGMVAALFLGYYTHHRFDVGLALNGALAGLVAITANAHAVHTASAIVIGAVGGLVMLGAELILERLAIDDAVSAIPVHLSAGVWGTLAVAFFGIPEILGTGLSFWGQLQAQVLGIVVCFLWAFGLTYILLLGINRIFPLRVSVHDEQIGLNVSEHGASTELLDLLTAMEMQSTTGDLSLRVPVEPFTQIGQIAQRYNKVMAALEEAVARTEAIVRTARDGIITFSKDSLKITAPLNPAAEAIFGYSGQQVWEQPLSTIIQPQDKNLTLNSVQGILAETARMKGFVEFMGLRADGTTFPVECTVSEATVGQEPIYIGSFRDITNRKQTERELQDYREQLEDQVSARTAELIAANEQLLQEISERQRAEEALQLTQFSVENASHPVYWIGPDAEFLYANKTACRLLGYSHNELLEMSFYDIDLNYSAEFWPSHWRSTQQNAITVESRHRSKNGQTFPVEVTFTYLEFNDQAYNFVFARDITRRLWASQALKESEERFKQVVSSISEHIYLIEIPPNGQPFSRYISPNIEQLSGYTSEKLIASWRFWLTDVVHPEDRVIVDALLQTFASGQNSAQEYRIIDSNGELIWVRDSGQIEINTLTKTVIVYGVISNITERKNHEQALSLARDDALQASRFKSQLLAMVSHELRTPLNAVFGYTDMLLKAKTRGPLTERQERLITRIKINSEKLNNLISNLLNQAQFESGKIEIHLNPFSPKELLKNLEAVLRPQAQAKKLNFTRTVDEGLPLMLVGDFNRLQDILINLANNAIKFTANGSVSIRIYRYTPTHWAMEVADTGVGIPKEDQTQIFKPFRQVDGTTTRDYGGSGLGLSIVKNLTKLMGGQIVLESKEGQGSTFTVVLPIKPN